MKANRPHNEGGSNISFVEDIGGRNKAKNVVDSTLGIVTVRAVKGDVSLNDEVDSLQRETIRSET